MIPAHVQRKIALAQSLRWQLHWPRTAIVELLPPEGFGAGGLALDLNAGTRKVKVNDDLLGEYEEDIPHTYAGVLARVLVTHECREIEPGDVVRFPAMNYEDTPLTESARFVIMAEKVMLAIVEGFDAAAHRLTRGIVA